MVTTATPKQVSWIRSMLLRKDHGLSPEQVSERIALMDEGNLSKTQASVWIDFLLPFPAKSTAPLADIAEGFYARGDEVAVVKFNRQGTRKYAMLLRVEKDISAFRPHPDEDVDPDEFLVERKHAVRVGWDYSPGLIGRIAREGWDKLTIEQAAEFGKLYGRCMICGRTLTQPESIERGIGPICAGKLA